MGPGSWVTAFSICTQIPNKDTGERISIAEVDARQVFAIEDKTDPHVLLGYHIAEVVPDFRDPGNIAKSICNVVRSERNRTTMGSSPARSPVN